MEMPAYAARYALPMPEVDILGVPNGQALETGQAHTIRSEAVSLGPDDLAGTFDDGEIHTVELLLNGSSQGVLEGNETTDSFFDFTLPNTLASGEYLMEVRAEDINGQISRAERWISLTGMTDANVSLHTPLIGETLKTNEVVDVNYSVSGGSSVSAVYLEVNDDIHWRGRLAFDGLGLPADESNLTLTDGTDRGTITFEFDSNQSASSTTIDPVEILSLSGEGNLTSEGDYTGIEPREYILEIDGDNTGISGEDTFRWSIDGGKTFVEQGIEIPGWFLTDSYDLSAGVDVRFDSITGYKLGDKWRIKAYPNNQIVEVGRFGTLADQLETTRHNLIQAINRTRNDDKHAIYARELTVATIGGFPMQNLGEGQIELIHDGSYPVISTITATGSTAQNSRLLSDELLSIGQTTGTTGTISLDLRRYNNLGSMLKLRVISRDTSGNLSYSEPRFYSLVDGDRPYVELINPLEEKPVAPPGNLKNFDCRYTGGHYQYRTS